MERYLLDPSVCGIQMAIAFKVDVMSRWEYVKPSAIVENELLLGPLELLSANRWVPITLVFTKQLDREAFSTALQATLNRFPIFAGRLQWKLGKAYPAARLKVVVDPMTCGVLFTSSVSSIELKDIIVDENVSSWPSRSRLTKSFMAAPHAMTMHKMIKESTALVHITLTQLTGGSVLCAEFAHCIGDGSSFYHFLKRIADASMHPDPDFKFQLTEQQSPFELIYNSVTSVSPIAPSWLFVAPSPRTQSHRANLSHELMVNTKVFWFTQEQVDKIKSKASKGAAVSANVALTALLWKLSSMQDDIIPSHLRILMNFRSALNPSLPPESMGNMIYPVIVKGDSSAIVATTDISTLALRCRQGIDSGRVNVVNDLATVYQQASTWSKVYWNDPSEEHNITSVTSLAAFNFVALQFPCHDQISGPSFTSAVDQLESPLGGFQNFFQVFTDARGGLRVIAHLPPHAKSSFEEQLKHYLVRSYGKEWS